MTTSSAGACFMDTCSFYLLADNIRSVSTENDKHSISVISVLAVLIFKQ